MMSERGNAVKRAMHVLPNEFDGFLLKQCGQGAGGNHADVVATEGKVPQAFDHGERFQVTCKGFGGCLEDDRRYRGVDKRAFWPLVDADGRFEVGCPGANFFNDEDNGVDLLFS